MTNQRAVTGRGWTATLALLDPILALHDPAFLIRLRAKMERSGVAASVRDRDSAAFFNCLIEVFQFQGISDAAASSFLAANGTATFIDLSSTLSSTTACRKLTSYWAFDNCNYRRSARACSRPDQMRDCPLPLHSFRNGRLSQAAYSLFLFIRDICGGDLVTWIDDRLAAADDNSIDRVRSMRRAVLEPMANIYGVSNKVLSMAMADLLLGADRSRERWIETGASMIAIDTLVHNFLRRTGLLLRHGTPHSFGPACYRTGGCAEVIEDIAGRTDARALNSANPRRFPRLVQHSIWTFCAQRGWNICNGNVIDDRDRCANSFCPAHRHCCRHPLGQH